MENLGDKVLRKIKEEKIRPRPRWQFLLEEYIIWLFFFASLILGALAFCVTLHIFSANDWDLYRYLHTSLVGHILISIPYLWIVFLSIFIWVAYYNFKYTKSGYRRETYLIVGLSVVGSLLLGAFLNTLGTGEKIEDAVAASVPIYEKITCCANRKDIWVQPANGLLAGSIIAVIDSRNFELKDFFGTNWRVQEDDDTLEYAPLEFKANEKVKIIGEKEPNFVFWAREVRPWKKSGQSSHSAKDRFEKDN